MTVSYKQYKNALDAQKSNYIGGREEKPGLMRVVMTETQREKVNHLDKKNDNKHQGGKR